MHVNVELVVGRDQKSWYEAFGKIILPSVLTHECSNICLTNPKISNRHLRIYTLSYDEDHTLYQVAPLVYVEDMSTNGTILRRSPSCVSQGSVTKSSLLAPINQIPLSKAPDIGTTQMSENLKFKNETMLLDDGDQLLLGGGAVTLIFRSTFQKQVLDQKYSKPLNHKACFL